MPFFVVIPRLVAEHGFLLGMKPVFYAIIIGLQFLFIAFSKRTNMLQNKRICLLISLLCILNTYVPLMVYVGYTDFMDVDMIKDAGWYDTWVTVAASIGTFGVIAVGIGIWFLQTSFRRLLQEFTYAADTILLRILGYSSFATCFVILIASPSVTAEIDAEEQVLHEAAPTHQQVAQKEHTIGQKEAVQPIQIPTDHFETDAKEHVIIVQLESANSMLINGYGTDEVGPTTYKKYMPNMTKIAKENGVLFPMFWSNTIQTGRAMSTILCGTVNNIHSSLTNTIEKIPHKCLPEILKESGYSTHFYSAHPNPRFQNKDEFTEKTGFEYRHWGEYAKGKVRRYKWGYDDCGFYTETAKQLAKERKDGPVFAYISLSSHHVPFSGKQEYKDYWPFAANEDYTEKTLNSHSMQDYCLSYFMQVFQDIIPEAHVFILSDHSFPTFAVSNHATNQLGVSADNFLVPLAYLPPHDERATSYMGEVKDGRHFSHADFLPTLFEILNGKPYKNSYAYALRKYEYSDSIDNRDIMYEKCHIFTQPYNGGIISVLRNNTKYNYYISNGATVKHDIVSDLVERKPTIIGEALSYQEFVDRYYCDRYKMFM